MEFFTPNFVLSINHNNFPNYIRKLLVVSIDAKSYENYFIFEHLNPKVDSFTTKYKNVEKRQKLRFFRKIVYFQKFAIIFFMEFFIALDFFKE